MENATNEPNVAFDPWRLQSDIHIRYFAQAAISQSLGPECASVAGELQAKSASQQRKQMLFYGLQRCLGKYASPNLHIRNPTDKQQS